MPLDTLAMTRMQLRLAPDAKVITLGAQSTWGLLNDDEAVTTDEMGQPITVRTRLVHVAANALSGVVDGATLKVAGTSYTVRGRPMPQENGDLWAIPVAKVDA